METNITVDSNTEIHRSFGVVLADYDIEVAGQTIPAVRVSLDLGLVLKTEADDVWASKFAFLPSTKAEITLTADEIDYLVKRLQIARSLIGNDFLVHYHIDQYDLDGDSFDFDGNLIER